MLTHNTLPYLAYIEVYDPVEHTWHPVLVEIADTSAERQIGLMNRSFLPSDQGML
ncbi:MAG: DUF192 domain-containing protein, partial [Proteobacteria bacterium]|nr:DUF192 domain-containing protein [Pseudomonadota bacterium]